MSAHSEIATDDQVTDPSMPRYVSRVPRDEIELARAVGITRSHLGRILSVRSATPVLGSCARSSNGVRSHGDPPPTWSTSGEAESRQP